MKNLVITALIALALTSGVNELLYHLKPYPYKSGVMGVSLIKVGIKRGESMIPEMNVTDGYRPVYVMKEVGDADQDIATEFPLQAIQ